MTATRWDGKKTNGLRLGSGENGQFSKWTGIGCHRNRRRMTNVRGSGGDNNGGQNNTHTHTRAHTHLHNNI